jgi:hypothetical protein
VARKPKGKRAMAKIAADIKGSASGGRKASRSRQQEYSTLTVTATNQGDTVWWEILPADGSGTPSLADDASYLSGEVFIGKNTTDRLDACVIKRQGKSVQTAIEITGSVRVSMADLIIGNVEFMDRLGKK